MHNSQNFWKCEKCHAAFITLYYFIFMFRHACGMEWYDPGMHLDYKVYMKVFHRIPALCGMFWNALVYVVQLHSIHTPTCLWFSFFCQTHSALSLGHRTALGGWCLVWEITAVILQDNCIFCMTVALFYILENCFNILKSTYYYTNFKDPTASGSTVAATPHVCINCHLWQGIKMYKRCVL
jgi:hypothetical protein